MVAAFGRTLALLNISAASWLLMRVNGFVPHSTQDNWLAVGNQLKAATLAKEFRLALVEVARQRLNKSINGMAGGMMSKRWSRSSCGESSRA